MSEEPGFRPIGNLVQRIASSLMPADSIPERSPTSSPTTGKQGPGPSSAIGLRRGEHGADASSTPAEVDRNLLASLPPSVGSALKATISEFVDPVYGYECEFVGYTLAGSIPSRDRQSALGIVGAALVPAAPAFVRQELARLRAATKARPDPSDDLAMRFQVLAEVCQDYPPDVVRHALRGWAKREVFFPALAEIRDELQRTSRRRRALLECLSRAKTHLAEAAE
jgi:hypothetical protein